MTIAPDIAILLASYNGAKFIGEQLQSIASQSHRSWHLWVSDDFSSDATRDIIREFADRNPGRVTLIDGPGRGSFANFMSLLGRQDISADFVALADQDDVWLPGKLAAGIARIETMENDRPVLYGGRTIIVSDSLEPRGLSPLFERTPGFRNALVQSIAGGNTMILNRPAHELVRRTATGPAAVTHDWWIYQIVSGAGGSVFYDPEPHMLYRQHGNNLIGTNSGAIARIRRVRALLNGRFRAWNGRNLAALSANEAFLTPENKDLVHAFSNLRKSSGFAALRDLGRLGLYRQTRLGNWSLNLAACIGRL